MSAIGPNLPPHLLAKRKRQHEERAENAPSTASGAKHSSSPEDASKKRRVMGPAMPPAPLDERPSAPPSPPAPTTKVAPHPDSDSSDSDDDFGPALPSSNPDPSTTTGTIPPPATTTPPPAEVKPQRDEWMTMAPTADGLASRMDPSKPRPTKFNTGKSARSGASAGAEDNSAWHETPEQKQKRLADAVMGISNDAPAAKTAPKSRPAVRGEEGKESGKRGESLVERYQRTGGRSAEVDDPSQRAFDREKDMATGGIVGEKGRREVLRKAEAFGGKFQGGSYL